MSEDFDVSELFPGAPAKARRRPVPLAIPWYPLGHVVLAVAAAVVVWLALPVTLEHVDAGVRVGVAAGAAVVVAAVWARFSPVLAVVTTVVVGVLCAGAGALAFYAPVAVAVAAVAAVVARALAGKRGGDR